MTGLDLTIQILVILLLATAIVWVMLDIIGRIR
jgi:hypothetical protein